MSFSVGDKVVYPVHGAGTIEAIEEREVLGEARIYYIMYIPNNDMRVLIPVDNADTMGIRDVVDEDTTAQVLQILQGKATKMDVNWNSRYRKHLEKIKTGNICQVAQVIRNLVLRDEEKNLSSSERRLLDQAKQILMSELSLADDKAAKFADSLIAT